MKTFDINDPILTAYALGELDAATAAEVEAQLATDAALRAEVEAIRGTATALHAGFAAETAPGLTESQRMTVQRQPQIHSQPRLVFRGRSLWIGSALAAAACLMLALFITFGESLRDSNDMFATKQGGPEESARAQVPAGGRENKDGDIEQSLTLNLGTPATTTGAVEEIRYGVSSESVLAAKAATGDALVQGDGQALRVRELEESATGTRISELPVPGTAGGTARSSPSGGASGNFIGAVSAPLPPPSPPPAMSPPANTTPTRSAGVNGVDGDKKSEHDRVRELEAAVEGYRDAAEDVAARDDQSTINDRLSSKSADTRMKNTSGENYAYFVENEFRSPTTEPLSTFSADVDTASFANVRRFLNDGQLPPKDSIRVEEMINYFPYNYEAPTGDVPFSANIEVNQAPWNPGHRLVRVGLRGKDIKMDMRPATSIVFLSDVSGSMNQPNKLPYVKRSLLMLLEQLNGDDRLAIVTYAGNAGLAMDSTFCSHEKKPEIEAIINGLGAGGSTNGAGGINVAYDTAVANHIKGGVNRVILCTDGDFNVGVSSESELIKLIEEKRATGVYLSVLGFGTGNLQDAKMKQLSKHGNGNYAYIDSVEEGKRVLVDQLAGTLVTIAKDVKFQVEFNPAKVGAYRLVGYEQRIMAAEDFNNDLKDAGEVGAGHTVTALYEVIPPGEAMAQAMPPAVDELKYQRPAEKDAAEVVPSDELLTVKVRYKEPDGAESRLLEFPITDAGAQLNDASAEFKFAAAVASFGMILRDSPHKGDATLDKALAWWESSIGPNTPQQWHELSGLIQTAQRIQAPQPAKRTPVEPQ